MRDRETFSGGCLCGAVRYVAQGPALFHVFCHCRDCQRASGGGHMPVIGVAKTGFSASGPISRFASAGGSGATTIRNFCAECGSTLFGTPEVAPDLVTLYVGSLDDPSVFAPDHAQFGRDRQGWDRTSDGLTLFPGPAD